MNLHERLLPFLVSTASSAGIGKVIARRRLLTTDAGIERELGVDGRGIRCCFVTRTSDAVGDKYEEPDGHEYAATRKPVYEFEIWYGFDDRDESPSETEIDAAYEALVAKFDEQGVRKEMRETYRALIVEPLAMTERSVSMTPQSYMVSRIIAAMTIEGEAQ